MPPDRRPAGRELQEVWERLDGLARRLWVEDRLSAVPLQGLVEEFRERVSRAERRFQELEKSFEDKSRSMREDMLAQGLEEMEAARRELDRLRTELARRDETLAQERERTQSAYLEAEARAAEAAEAGLWRSRAEDLRSELARQRERLEAALKGSDERETKISELRESLASLEAQARERYARKEKDLFDKLRGQEARFSEFLEARVAELERQRLAWLEAAQSREERLSKQHGEMMEEVRRQAEALQDERQRLHQEHAARVAALEAAFRDRLKALSEPPAPHSPSRAPAPAPSEASVQAAPKETPPARPPRKRTGVLLLLVLLLAAAAWWLKEGGVEVRPLPIAHTAGLFWMGETLYTVDWMSQQVYSIEADSGKIVETRLFPNVFVTGLALWQGDVWSLDGYANRLVRHRASDFSVLKTTPIREDPFALASDEAGLWIGGSESKTVRKVGLPGLLPIGEVELPFPPQALARIGEELWALDRENTIHVFKAAGMQPVRAISLAEQLPRSGRATGFSVHGKKLWVVTENPCVLVSMPLP